jgi:gluconate 2-dehydrogenase gamma chain
MIKKYPLLTVRKLLQTDFISEQTKEVLTERLQELNKKYEPRFFSPGVFSFLQAVCDRLIPQFDSECCIDLAASIDRRLHEGKNDGWRYAFMPPDGECYQLGLVAINETSIIKFGKTFIELEPQQQDSILHDVQSGNVTGDTWQELSPHHFFQELLAELTEAFYSHPLAQEEIGYAGMADNHGWKAIGLNQLDPHEPDEKTQNE